MCETVHKSKKIQGFLIFTLEPSEQAKAAIGKRVTVVDHPDGRLAIRYEDVELAYAPSTSCPTSTKARSPTTSSWGQYWR
jgi:hypothetical protein